MVNVSQSPYSKEQISAWLRGLLTIAWADGHYDSEEQELIAELMEELTQSGNFVQFKSITPQELATSLGKDHHTCENFLRTAVLVALADGVYSTPEADLIHQFSESLGLKIEAIEALEHTLCQPVETSDKETGETTTELVGPPQPHPSLLKPVKNWLDDLEVRDPRLARFVCKMVPSQCPFERDIKLFGHKIVHIPPMCKLNPLYEQLVGLRFRALSYLADECQEDVSQYV